MSEPRAQRERRQWEEQFEALKQFKKEHGHCNVKQVDTNKKLATWVLEQRRRRRQKKMPEERFRRLTKLGFEFQRAKNRPNELWSQMLARLKAYKKEHGDCIVPQRYKKDTKLGRWVSMQRQLHHQNSMSKDRLRKLEEVGFVWHAEGLKTSRSTASRKLNQRIASARGRGRKRRRTIPPRDDESTETEIDERRKRKKREKFEVGTFVMKYFGEDGWFLGEIASNSGGYRVVYEGKKIVD
jgi:hypothetical protein